MAEGAATVATSNAIRFDKERHEYWHGSRRLPGVTQVLKPLMPDYSFADPRVGTAAHKITAAWDAGATNEEAIRLGGLGEYDSLLGGYLSAWRAFREHFAFLPTVIEEVIGDPLMGFAGSVDRIGSMNDRPVILDIKTGSPEPWHGLQLAGYELGAAAMGLAQRGEVQRLGVYLTAEGRYATVEYADPRDIAVFHAALLVHQWKESNT